ncbi:hypothetical protein [Comamonas aquatica]|uniref:hypothetical protein n=1 Tax=Comamonas aquatica TaxID=225991 RepID=UPI0012DDD4F9|nr:hypothetical protein [Comamonas aquatica]
MCKQEKEVACRATSGQQNLKQQPAPNQPPALIQQAPSAHMVEKNFPSTRTEQAGAGFPSFASFSWERKKGKSPAARQAASKTSNNNQRQISLQR